MSWFSPCTPSLKPCICVRADYKVRDGGAKVRASKCVQLYRLPRVLVLHLKRFKNDESAGSGKLHKPVRFDATLRCGPGACCAATPGDPSASVSLDETMLIVYLRCADTDCINQLVVCKASWLVTNFWQSSCRAAGIKAAALVVLTWPARAGYTRAGCTATARTRARRWT